MTYQMPINRPKSDVPASTKGKRLKRTKRAVVMTEQQLINNVNCRFVIGIDPDNKKYGFASIDRQSKRTTIGNPFMELATLSPFKLLQKVGTFPKDTTIIYLELPSSTKIWHGESESEQNYSQAARLSVASTKGIDVGRNRGYGECMYDMLVEWGYNVVLIEPLNLVNGKKCNDEGFRKRTGYDGPRCNQEQRDAGLIADRFK